MINHIITMTNTGPTKQNIFQIKFFIFLTCGKISSDSTVVSVFIGSEIEIEILNQSYPKPISKNRGLNFQIVGYFL